MKKWLLYCALLACLCVAPGLLHAQVTFLHEDFSSCTGSLPAGWTKYSVNGTDSWTCSSSGHSGNAVMMSGYSNGNNNQNEDWLISPQLNLSGYSSPQLDFWCRTKFGGPYLQVMVSNNYAGTGNPNTATWTALPVMLPAVNSDLWTLAGPLNLTPYKSLPLHIAYKYISNTSAAATWRIDEVAITEGALSLSRAFVNAGQCGAGSSSAGANFAFTMSSLSGPFEVQVPSPFEVSKDGLSYGTAQVYPASAAGTPQTVFVRVSPQVSDKVYRKTLRFFYNGYYLNQEIRLLGTSLPDDKTLRVFNWNMRWFGDPSFCACDTALAKNNAIRVLKDIQADVYCLQEVVSLNQLAQVCGALGANYSYVASPFGSGAPNVNSANYPGAQKLAFIYNTQKLSNAGTFGLLASTYPADTSAYACFSSGRFPFVMKAALHLQGGGSDTVMIANIHAKASGTLSDYNRRVCAAQAMTDSLNALFPGKKILVLGDFNDYLDGSFVSGQTVSPYQYLLSQGFQGITAPAQFAGQSTFTGSADHMIDHVVSSSALWSAYADSSCFVFTEPAGYLSDYAGTTSDHYPVMSYFKFNFPNGIEVPVGNDSRPQVQLMNPSDGTLLIQSGSDDEVLELRLFDLAGKTLWQQTVRMRAGRYRDFIPGLSSGLYLLEIRKGSDRKTEKWMIR